MVDRPRGYIEAGRLGRGAGGAAGSPRGESKAQPQLRHEMDGENVRREGESRKEREDKKHAQ